MPPIDSPWEVVTKEIDRLKQNNVTSVIIDFHAEATAEKICFSKYLAKNIIMQSKLWSKVLLELILMFRRQMKNIRRNGVYY